MWLFVAVAAFLSALAAPALAQGGADGVAVIIGNRSYEGRVPLVEYAHQDADAMRRYVIDHLGYRDENVIDLRDASQGQMLSVFGNAADHRGKLWSLVRPGRSDVVVYYSGHGVPGQRDRRGYLLPVDADVDTPEINGFALDTLYANLARLQARQVTVYIDACFSGDSQAGSLIRSASPVHLLARPATVPSQLVVLTAAQADQLASWDTAAGQGLFTRHLLAALDGEADRRPWGNGDGRVSLHEAKAYLDDEMSYAARRLFKREQQASASGPDDAVLSLVALAPAAATPAPQPAPTIPAVLAPAAPPGGVPVPRERPTELAALSSDATPSDAAPSYTLPAYGTAGSPVPRAPAAAEVPAAAPSPAPAPSYTPSYTPPPAAADDGGQAELLFWESVRDSSDPSDLEAYLARFPTGTFAVLARNRLASMRNRPAVTVVAPARGSPPRPSSATAAAAPGVTASQVTTSSPRVTSIPAPAGQQPAPAPAQVARLTPPNFDGEWTNGTDSWFAKNGDSTVEISGSSGSIEFYFGGTTYHTTITLAPDGTVTNGFVMFDMITGVQFRGKMPNVTYEVFGNSSASGVIALKRSGSS